MMNEKVRIELLNDGCYKGLRSVTFPVIVDAYPVTIMGNLTGYNVPQSEIIKLVTDVEKRYWTKQDHECWYWSLTSEECRPL